MSLFKLISKIINKQFIHGVVKKSASKLDKVPTKFD